jgi:lipopolysaccharide/colanic/teichoic acid biosynthesis glycosyltransferase
VRQIERVPGGPIGRPAAAQTVHKRGVRAALDAFGKGALDLAVAALLLVLLLPVILACAVLIKAESRGPVFYRCRRVGRGGREFAMLKFRKMRVDAAGPPLTSAVDERFTRVGRLLAKTKLDELPQLWNVIRGEMSLVGPRPEDPSFVAMKPAEFAPVLAVKPGITGLSQLAFACESAVLDRDPDADRVESYVERLLPQKLRLDALYASRRTVAFDLRILTWTAVAVVLRRDVAVNRETAELGIRRRPQVQTTEELVVSEQPNA